MSLYIVKCKKTSLRTPLLSSGATVKLRELVDIDDRAVALADFGEWFVLVLKQGDTVEIIKCDGLTQNADGTADCTVATNGRSISPYTPYAGASTGEDFQTAEVIVTNDPLTMSRFGCLDNANTWDERQTFTTLPTIPLTPTATTDAASKGYVDSVVAGTAVYDQHIITGTAGETLAAGELCYFKESDQRWWKTDSDAAASSLDVELGFAQASATAGVSVNILRAGLEKNLSGLTAGAKYYVSANAGAITTSENNGNFPARFVGWAISTTRLLFDPDALEMANIVTGQAGETITAGQAVYYKAADELWYKTDADAAATATGVQIGFALVGSSVGNDIIVRTGGVMWSTALLTAGAKYYLSGTAGSITSTQGTFPRFVGVAVSANRLLMVDSSNLFAIEQHGQQVYAATATGNDTYVVSLNPTLPALINGLKLGVKLDVGNTGAATLNADSTGAKKILMPNGDDLITGAFSANDIISVVYNSSADGGTGAFVVTGMTRATPPIATGTLTDVNTTAAANNDETVTTGFTPRFIKLHYFIQGHTPSAGTNVYTGMKGVAVFNSAGTLVFNDIQWGDAALSGDNGVPTALAALVNTPNSTAALVAGDSGVGAGSASLTLTISAVSATGFTVRRASTSTGASSTARAKVAYEVIG